MSFQTARNTLAAQLTNNAAWSTFSYPPAVPQVNSVVLEPDDPYIANTNQKSGLSCRLRFRVRLYAPLFDNQGNLAQIEDLAQQVRVRIIDATQNCGDLSQPQVMSIETGDLLTAYFPVEILSEWSA